MVAACRPPIPPLGVFSFFFLANVHRAAQEQTWRSSSSERSQGAPRPLAGAAHRPRVCLGRARLCPPTNRCARAFVSSPLYMLPNPSVSLDTGRVRSWVARLGVSWRDFATGSPTRLTCFTPASGTKKGSYWDFDEMVWSKGGGRSDVGNGCTNFAVASSAVRTTLHDLLVLHRI